MSMVIGVGLGAGALFLILLIGAGLFVASIIPLDIQQYKDWTIQQLYYELHPYLKEDFRGLKDCQNIHSAANMTTGDAVVSHITFQPAMTTQADTKDAEYRQYAAAGTNTIEIAQQTGTFAGRAR